MDVNNDKMRELAAEAGVEVPEHPLVAGFTKQINKAKAFGFVPTEIEVSQEVLRGLWRLCGKIDGIEMKLARVHVAGLPCVLAKDLSGASFRIARSEATAQLTPAPVRPE